MEEEDKRGGAEVDERGADVAEEEDEDWEAGVDMVKPKKNRALGSLTYKNRLHTKEKIYYS